MASKNDKSIITSLNQMAAAYGMEDNALFKSLIETYCTQIRVIQIMRDELEEADLAVSKEYVKGRENLYAHPLIKELPKHSDSATRTAGMIVDVIKKLGEKKDDTDEFEDFVDGK